MIHIHMLLAVFVVQFFVFQAYTALATDKIQPKLRTMIAHSMYLLMIITGVMMLKPIYDAGGDYQWAVAKGILLVAVMSSSVKAFRPTATLAQRKAGIFVASVGLLAIIALAFIQPANFI